MCKRRHGTEKESFKIKATTVKPVLTEKSVKLSTYISFFIKHSSNSNLKILSLTILLQTKKKKDIENKIC